MWGHCTFINTVVATLVCFVVYDLFYFSFHHILHHTSMFTVVHRHYHHRMAAPHPLEFLASSYFHLLAVMVVSLSPIGCHAYAVIAFSFFSAVLATCQHTRLHIAIPFFHAASDHDVHHQDSHTNFGQYTVLWDYLCRTQR